MSFATGLEKLALTPPTQVDSFMAAVENGKDVPIDPTSSVPGDQSGIVGENPMAWPQENGPPKMGALGLKDMLFFEKMMGPQQARSMFQGIEHSMSGQTPMRPQTLNITPQGVQRMPHPAFAGARPPALPKLGHLAEALEKFAVSGAMYARALQSAAGRSGARLAPSMMSQVAAQPRAQLSRGLGAMARESGGALAPTPQQEGLQSLMKWVPFGGEDTGGAGAQDPRQRLMFNRLLRAGGKATAAPGLNEQILSSFGTPWGDPVAPSALAQTVAGSRARRAG